MSTLPPPPPMPGGPQKSPSYDEQERFGAPAVAQETPYGPPPTPQPQATPFNPPPPPPDGEYSGVQPVTNLYDLPSPQGNPTSTQSPYARNIPNEGSAAPEPYAQPTYIQEVYSQNNYGSDPNVQQAFVQETYSQDDVPGVSAQQTYAQETYAQDDVSNAAVQQTYVQETYTQDDYGSSAEIQEIQQTEPITNQKSKLVAGLLNIFLGVFGVGNFYLGYTAKGVIQLLLGLSAFGAPISSLWGLVEGILILVAKPGSNASFDAAGVPLAD